MGQRGEVGDGVASFRDAPEAAGHALHWVSICGHPIHHSLPADQSALSAHNGPHRSAHRWRPPGMSVPCTCLGGEKGTGGAPPSLCLALKATPDTSSAFACSHIRRARCRTVVACSLFVPLPTPPALH